MTDIVIRPAVRADRDRWALLFAAYREFYDLRADPDVIARVWGWINDPDHEVQALVADVDGTVVGLAHYRAFARPSTGTVGMWLDDLFTDPSARGQGAGRALIERLRQLAGDQGQSVVRWITAANNARARLLYDAVGTATQWVTYDAEPAQPRD